MAGKIVSIEIGEQVTKICEAEYKKKNPHVYHWVSFETPKNAIEDGHILDQGILAREIKAQMERAGIKNDKVVFTVASTKIANREVTIPEVKENRIREIVKTNARDYFPINIEEYIISHVVLEKVEEKENKNLRLLVLAAPEEMIKGYYELADRMKLTVTAIDYVGNSSYQMVRYQNDTGVSLVVQINEQNTIINLLEKNSLLLQRTLPYGTNMVVQAVMENKEFHAETAKEAAKLLAEQPIVNPQFTEYINGNQGEEDTLSQAKEEVTNTLKVLLSNINRVIDYCSTKHSGMKIDNIRIAGDGFYIQNIERLIGNEIGIETKKAEHLGNVTFVKDAANEVGRENYYVCCIGAAIAPTEFAPRELAKKEKVSGGMKFPLIMLGVCGAGALLIFLSSVFLYREANRKKLNLEEKIAEIEDINAIVAEYEETKQNREVLEEIDAQTSNKSEQFGEVFAELEGKTPKGCTLTSMQYGDMTLTLQVRAENKTLCAKYIQNLKTIERFDEVKTSGYTEEDSSKKNGSVTFTVVATFK